MKKFLFILSFLFIIVISVKAQDITNSVSLNGGFGFSGWGVPVYAGIDFPVHEDITVGGNASFQTKGENWGTYNWRHTIIGISGRGDYHFNRILELPSEWDLYGGLSLGYWIWKTKYDGSVSGYNYSYTGSGSGGLGINAQVGGRYFFKENMAINLELGGGTVLSGGRIGITVLL